MLKTARRIAVPAALALALLTVSTGPAAAAAERYREVAATLDGKWKSLGSYYRNLDGTTDDMLCVRTYNSAAGAESYAALKDADTGEFYAWIEDNRATDGEPACTDPRDFRTTGKALVLVVEHTNTLNVVDAKARLEFTG